MLIGGIVYFVRKKRNGGPGKSKGEKGSKDVGARESVVSGDEKESGYGGFRRTSDVSGRPDGSRRSEDSGRSGESRGSYGGRGSDDGDGGRYGGRSEDGSDVGSSPSIKLLCQTTADHS
jgi:hypothetical protein